jgi:excinuclease ABC subunit C
MSALEQVEGIGKKRRKMLLDVFGSLEELKKASPDKIARLAGVPLKVAERLLEVLNKEGEKEEEES